MSRGRLALRLGFISAALVLVALAVYWVAHDAVTHPTSSADKTHDVPIDPDNLADSPVAPIAAATLRPSGSPSWPALPDIALPLSQQLPTLLQRADLGDPVASCRLIIGINRCIEFKRNQTFSDRMQRSLESQEGRADHLMIGLVARSQEHKEAVGSYCDALQFNALPRVDDLLRRTLGALTPRQKTTLAMMRSDGELNRLRRGGSFSESSLYVIPQFIADRTHEFLMSGYQARDPLALEGLAMLHSPGHAAAPRGVAVWLPNPRLFLQYTGLMAALYGSGSLGDDVNRLIDATAATMTPPQLEAVQQHVQSERQRWTRDIERRDAARADPAIGPDPTVPGDCLG